MALALAATLLTLALALPVLVQPDERIFGNEVVGRHPDAYMAIEDYAHPRLHAKTQPATDLLGMALGGLIGGVAAFNVVVLLSFPLTAVCTYLLGRHLDLGPPFAAFAALLFSFSAFHLSHAAYHPHISQTQWLPLYLLALWKCLDGWTRWRALGLLAALAGLTFSNFYAGYFAAFLTPVFLAAYWWTAPRTGARDDRSALLTAGLLATLAAIAAIWPLFIFRRLELDVEGLTWPVTDLFLYGARWWSYLVPPLEHPVLGDIAAATWAQEAISDGVIEQQLSLGLAVVVLAVVPIVAWLRGERGTVSQRAVPALAAIGAVAFVSSLTPATRDGDLLPLPGALLYGLVPLFRAYARFGAFAQLMLVLLAAIGLAWLWRRPRPPARAAAVALLALVVFENPPYPPARFHDVLPTRAHRWIEEQPGEQTVLECVNTRDTGEFMVRRLMSDSLLRPGRLLDDCGEPGLASKLAAHGVTHVIVRSGTPVADRFASDGPPSGLRHHLDFGDSTLWLVEAEPEPLHLLRHQGFSWREYSNRRTYRWMADEGALVFRNASSAPRTTELRLELSGFPGERELTVQVADAEPIVVRVFDRPHFVELGPVTWPKGDTTIRLLPSAPAQSPAELGTGADERRLSIAVWGWELRPVGE
ncbi:MAG: hypothetical protein R3190_02595 [Thermoanaerobaculia bacterium]|nr:hypothetical protein [Thermoanaerobaculia bacterium]